MKRSVKIMFCVNSKTADFIQHTFSRVRKKCNRPYASSSKINRSFWMALYYDEALTKRVLEAVCKFIDDYDTSA